MLNNEKSSFLSWYFIRVAALLLVPGILFDSEIFFLIQSFFLIHLKVGLEVITLDYIHNHTTRLLYLFFLRLLTLEILIYSIELIL